MTICSGNITISDQAPFSVTDVLASGVQIVLTPIANLDGPVPVFEILDFAGELMLDETGETLQVTG